VDLVNMPIENKRRAEGIGHAAASVRRARMIEVDRLLELLEGHCDPVRGQLPAHVARPMYHPPHEQQSATSKTTSRVLLMSADGTNATRRRPADVIYA
jgi:hypothetical protein